MTEETLFALALEKPSGADRRAFLDAACGGDSALRDRVDRLLAADERTRGILDQAAAAVAEVPRVIQETDPPAYELAEPVGEGGMGTVFRARDARLDRDVAVKVLHPRFPADGPAANRFLGEARVTARLQHPGVPPVHRVGTLPDGRPFLAMKLIRGRTLADLLAADPGDRGRLLAAFEQVCQAVAYAHSHKVIHRDLKPANVMIGAFGEVQVMDWGLAKILGPAAGPAGADAGDATAASELDSDRGAGDATQTGSVLGTPAYMPPEQAAGAVDRIDERSDVFGLGAILCAILTGKPPYAGAGPDSARQSAAGARLDNAYARLDGCGADPGWAELCKRCLAVEQTDRPADAGEVAKAVAGLRAAADERARRAELDRARAEAEARGQRKRRRAHLALAVVVGLLLAAGGAFGWYSDHQAAQRRARLADNGRAVADLLDQCEASLRDNRADPAGVALGAAERRAADDGADAHAARLARCRADLALLRALDDADTFRWTWGDDAFPDAAAVAGRWRAALADYGLTPDDGPDAAARAVDSPIRDRVLTTLDGLLAFDPSAGVRAVLRAADPDPFRDAVRDALAAGDGDALAALARRPEALAQPARFAAVFGRLRAVPADRGRVIVEAALQSRTDDVSLLMALGTSYPIEGADAADERVRWYQAALAARPGTVGALNNLGLALRAKGDLDGAVAPYREAIRLRPNFARCLSNLGFALRAKGEPDAAVAAYQEAIRADPNYATPHNNLGLVLKDKGDREGAAACFREAVRINPNYAKAYANLGYLLQEKGDTDGAAACFRELVRLRPESGAAQYDLGNALRAKRDTTGAVAAFQEAVRLNPDHAIAHFNLGNALRDQRNMAGALAAYQEAVRADPNYAAAHVNLGNSFRDLRKTDAAVAAYREAVRADPNFAPAHVNLGVMLCDEKRDYDGAVAAFRQAVRLKPSDAGAHVNLGLALRKKGSADEAAAALREAIRIAPRYAYAHHNLGAVLCDLKGDFAGAVAAFREAIRLNPKSADSHFGLGVALRKKGDAAGAAAAYRDAIRLDPTDPESRNNLAWLLAAGPNRVRDGAQAVVHATRACELTGWKDPISLTSLAAAQAEAGNFDRAVEFQKKALSFPAYEKQHRNVVQEQLRLYARKQPYRDPAWVPREVAPPPRPRGFTRPISPPSNRP